MKAQVLYNINDLRYEEVEKPVLEPGEVLVEVHAAGICGSDVPRIFRTGTYSYPLIAGHEFSGKVVETGKEADENWIGKRVGIFPLIPCKQCAPCASRHYEMCRRYSYLGSRTNGGFAEYAVVPEWNLLELPAEVSYQQAAMLEPMAVAVHAMRSAFAEKSDQPGTVAVCGLGTIGILLTMFLKEAGVTDIFVTGNKDFQKKMALGLDIPEEHFCDSRNMNAHEWLMEKTLGQGADIYFECVGRNETIMDAVRGTAPGKTVQLVGNPASDICFDKDIYWKILRNQLTIKGSWNSSFTHSAEDDWHYVLDRLQSGRIQPEKYITQKFRLEELEKGLKIMRDKTQEYMKVMIEL